MGRNLGRYRCADTVSDWRGRDQQGEAPEEEEGELICRLTGGRDGNYTGHDGRGRILRIKRAKDGALEIRHMAETGGEDEADPNIVGTFPAGTGQGEGGDPALAARAGTGDALSRYTRTGQYHDHIPALAAYQKRLDAYYGSK